jgi:hypothetical protein
VKRRRILDDIDDEQPARRLVRAVRTTIELDTVEDLPAADARSGPEFADALIELCSRFGLEPWAAGRDEAGLWAFASSIESWLCQSAAERPDSLELRLEAIRLLTNLLIVLGAVTRAPQEASPDGLRIGADSLARARTNLAAVVGPIPSFPGAGRAMQRLVRVRGWQRLASLQQSLAESLLGLYLEALAAISAVSDARSLLITAEAWLCVLQTRALPDGFDERILRATSWYLETYAASAPAAR